VNKVLTQTHVVLGDNKWATSTHAAVHCWSPSLQRLPC